MCTLNKTEIRKCITINLLNNKNIETYKIFNIFNSPEQFFYCKLFPIHIANFYIIILYVFLYYFIMYFLDKTRRAIQMVKNILVLHKCCIYYSF